MTILDRTRRRQRPAAARADHHQQQTAAAADLNRRTCPACRTVYPDPVPIRPAQLTDAGSSRPARGPRMPSGYVRLCLDCARVAVAILAHRAGHQHTPAGGRREAVAQWLDQQ